jgi:methionine sulfoxide reductase heme-binding subunit
MGRIAFILTGSILFACFLAQDFFDLKWEYLLQLQDDQMYRRWSGLVLSVIILFQWTLSIVRSTPKWEELSLTFYNIHNWMGAFTPLLFYFHSMKLGFAYLFVLSLTFFGNFLLGMLNLDVIKNKSQLIFQGWMITHVACSLFITFLTIYHVWVVFYYE